MQFNVAQLLKEPVGQSRHYQIDEVTEVIDSVEDSCNIKGEVELLRTDRGSL